MQAIRNLSRKSDTLNRNHLYQNYYSILYMFIVVCGNTLVEDMVRLESKMTALRDLYRDVIISKDIILKVGYSLEPFDLQTPSVNLLGLSHHCNSYINVSFAEPYENFHVIPG